MLTVLCASPSHPKGGCPATQDIGEERRKKAMVIAIALLSLVLPLFLFSSHSLREWLEWVILVGALTFPLIKFFRG